MRNTSSPPRWTRGMLCLGWVVWSVGTAAAQQPAKDSTPTKAQPPAAPAAAPAAPNAAGATPTAANAAASHPAAALGLTVYPAKSQTAAQQEADEQACYKWAGEQTGIDPATVKTNPDSAAKAAAAKTDSAAGGAAVKGAARGAVGGAVVGGIAGDAGTGAAIGAVAGAAGGRRAKKGAEKQAAQQGQAADAAQANQKIETFKKAMSACLEGREYSVK